MRPACPHFNLKFEKRVRNILLSTNFNAQFSLFINNMFVTLLSSTCFEDNSITNILLMNKENCALKLVDEIILYYDARSQKHQKKYIYIITVKSVWMFLT